MTQRLDLRLREVFYAIRSQVHIDVGSDHGNLIRELLFAKRIDRGIAIENKWRPFENSKANLLGCNAEVRFGEGLGCTSPNEADSVSICGMGGKNIVKILEDHPQNVPETLVIQPNKMIERVREWALNNNYFLRNETIVAGPRNYTVLSFTKSPFAKSSSTKSPSESDPAYDGIDKQSAVLFGPHLLKGKSPVLLQQLLLERTYFERLPFRSPHATWRLEKIRQTLREVWQYD